MKFRLDGPFQYLHVVAAHSTVRTLLRIAMPEGSLIRKTFHERNNASLCCRTHFLLRPGPGSALTITEVVGH